MELNERNAEVAYYTGYVRGLQETGTREKLTHLMEIQSAVISTSDKGSQVGYNAIGRLDGLKRSLKLTVMENRP